MAEKKDKNSLIFEWSNITKSDRALLNKWDDLSSYEELNNPDVDKEFATTIIDGAKNLQAYIGTENDLGDTIYDYFVSFDKYGADVKHYGKVAKYNGEIVATLAAGVVTEENGEVTVECHIFAVNPRFQKQGFGTAAIFDMVKRTKDIFGIKQKCKFVSYINKSNIASQKVFMKNGFNLDKDRYKKAFLSTGTRPTHLKFIKEKNK